MKNQNDMGRLTFTEPCCATCAAWKQTQGLNGECHLMPPQALFAGFQQPPQVAGLQMTGKLPPQPIILGAFPAVNAQNICRQWHQDKPEPKYGTMNELAFVPGEGLVYREVPFRDTPECPVEDGSYKLPREIEGAKHQDEIATCAHETLVYRFDRDGKFCEDCGAQVYIKQKAKLK